MTRNTLRGIGLVAACALVMSITASSALAKPKQHKGSGESARRRPTRARHRRAEA